MYNDSIVARALKGLALMIFGLGLSTTLLAESPSEVCNDQLLFAGCTDTTLTSDNLEGHACLQKFLACGRHEEIISAVGLRLLGPSPKQRYFVGASYFGLNVETRSLAEKCDQVGMAKKNLRYFLTSALEEFFANNSFATYNIQHVNHATKMMRNLTQVKGCVDNSVDKDEVKSIAVDYAHKAIKNVFFNSAADCANTSNATASQFMGKISCDMQGIVTNASDLEQGIALRKVEVKSLSDHLEGDGNGDPGIRRDIEFITTNVNATASTAAQYQSSASGLVTALESRISGFDLNSEDIAALQQSNLQELQSLEAARNQQSAIHTGIHGNTAAADSLLNQIDYMDDTGSKLEQLKSGWVEGASKDSARCRENLSDNWYCQEGE